MSDTSTTVPAVAGIGSDATGTAPVAQVTFATREEVEGFKKFINKEQERQRRATEERMARYEEFMKSFEDAETPAAATGSVKANKGSNDLIDAEARRELKAVQEQLAQERREKEDALISAAITSAVAGTVPEARPMLIKALRADAKIEKSSDGRSVVVIPAEDGPEPLTGSAIRKVYGDYVFPSQGRPGDGLVERGAVSGTSGIDWNLVATDQKYFDDNKPAILAEMARRHKVAAGG